MADEGAPCGGPCCTQPRDLTPAVEVLPCGCHYRGKLNGRPFAFSVSGQQSIDEAARYNCRIHSGPGVTSGMVCPTCYPEEPRLPMDFEEYFRVVVAGSPTTRDGGTVGLMSCGRCGSVVLQTPLAKKTHDDWHNFASRRGGGERG